MTWIYWIKLYETEFRAHCLATRMKEDWWIYGYESPAEVEIYRTRKSRYGVKYVW